MKLKIEEARKELKDKTENEIERETAEKWAARAIAAYELYLEDGEMEMFSRGDDNYHESLEHAALSESPTLVGEVKEEVGKVRQQCLGKKQKQAFLSIKQSRIVRPS